MFDTVASLFKRIPSWLIVLILILPTFYQLMRPGFFPMQDDLQSFRIHQLDKCVLDLQIPCRWVPDAGYQYGYPMFNFYSPSVFYLGEIFHLLGFQFIDSVKILFILGFFLSAVSMYLLLRSFLGEWPSIVGAVIYGYAPVKAVEVYVRGALNEFWALVFFPLLFWSSFKLVNSGKKRYLIFFVFLLSGLLLTHNLMSFIFFPTLVIWIIFWIFQEKKYKTLFKVLGGVILGFGLASFFIVPLVAEKQYVHLETLLSGYFDYRQHFVSVNELFFSNYFNYGSSVFGPNDEVSLSTGIVLWISALFSLILSLINHKKYPKIAKLVVVLALVELLVLFLMHQRSSFIWEKIELLKWLQFPWRFLTLSVFLLTIIASFQFILCKNKKISILLGLLMIGSSIVLHASFFEPKSWLTIDDNYKFKGESWEKQLTISIFDYLPIYATLPPNKKAPNVPEVLDGDVKFDSYTKGSNFQSGELVANRDSTIRLPLFDFPGMKVLLDNKKTEFTHLDCRVEPYCFGLISLKVPKGFHRLEVRLIDTAVRFSANAISVLSFIILSILIVRFNINDEF